MALHIEFIGLLRLLDSFKRLRTETLCCRKIRVAPRGDVLFGRLRDADTRNQQHTTECNWKKCGFCHGRYSMVTRPPRARTFSLGGENLIYLGLSPVALPAYTVPSREGGVDVRRKLYATGMESRICVFDTWQCFCWCLRP